MRLRYYGVTMLALLAVIPLQGQRRFRVMTYNVENLFDTRHDTLKNDTEFLPDAQRRWTPARYWRKLDRVASVIAAAGQQELPALVALCEVENDTVLVDLTRRSALRTAGYRYVMTDSPDPRGIDVALIYQPGLFRLLSSYSVRVPSAESGHAPTRDLLYVRGRLLSGDTLHVIVCHLPSKAGGTKGGRRHRMLAVSTLRLLADSIFRVTPDARLLIAGDFNASLRERLLYEGLQLSDGHAVALPQRLYSLSGVPAATLHGCARGTYKYRGEWESLDHLIVSSALLDSMATVYARPHSAVIPDFPFLMEPDAVYGGMRMKRTYAGPAYKDGYSDHLPLLADLWMHIFRKGP